MNFFEDTLAERARIEAAIQKYGYAPEHNFLWYEFYREEGEKNVFAACDDGSGLLTIEERAKKTIMVFSSPIAPPPRRVPMLIEYLEYIFQSPEIQKVTLELETPLRKEFLRALPSRFRARAINYSLTWPIYNLKTFNPALSGKHYKSLRKAKNKFYRSHAVHTEDARAYGDKNALHRIIDEWRKKRGGHDRAYSSEYHHIIDGNFAGTTEARVFIVDGRPTGMNAGWMIPQSSRFYGAIGIHDYSSEDLGDMLYLEDLIWLKNHGYAEADMAGGEKALTAFKNKFQPESFYKTHVFSVVKA